MSPDTAAEFLLRNSATVTDRPQLRQLAEILRTDLRGTVAKALTTPLAINLAIEAFGRPDTVDFAPEDLAALKTRKAVVTQLVGLFLDRAYSADHALAPARKQARRARHNARERAIMTWIAQRMGANPDLIWWHIPTGVPPHSIRGRAENLIGAVALAIMQVGWPFVDSHVPWWTSLLPGGMAFMIASFWAKRTLGRPPSTLAWRWPSLPDLARVAAIGALGGTLNGAVVVALGHGVWAGAAVAGVFMVMGVLGAGLADNFAGGLLASSTTSLADSPFLTPRDAYRADRRRTAVSAAVGATVGGVLIGLLGLFDGDMGVSALWGVSIGLAIGWVAGMGAAGLLALTSPRLTGAPRGSVRLMPTLQSAVQKRVLRQAGLVYQFRHAALQEYSRGLPDTDDVPGPTRRADPAR